jgi:uncharacterized membrane protein YkoI
MMDRRKFLLLLFASTSITVVLAGAPNAVAKNGSDDGDDSGSDSDSSGSGSGGGSGSGSGSGGGDHDSGSDDSDDSDSDSDDDSNDDDDSSNSGSGSSKSGRDHQRAREAVGQGRILPLREILRRVEDMGGGRVIAVNLDLEARKPFYTLKVQKGANVRTLKLDAASGRRLTLFGW